jgi:AmmeMemoRadiSam system protein A
MKLTELARNTLKYFFKHKKKYEPSEEIKKKYSGLGASFVTITKGGDLRGCMGSLKAVRPLWEDVRDNTLSCAFQDPRFVPLAKYELKEIRIEVSVLSSPKLLQFQDEKELLSKITKEMGIILRKGYYTSTFFFLFFEEISSKQKFMEQLSLKAGLSKDSWKQCEVWYYTIKKEKED